MADDVSKSLEDMFEKLTEIEASLKVLLTGWHAEACAVQSGFMDPATEILRSFAVKAVDVARDALILCTQLEARAGHTQDVQPKTLI